MTTTKPVLAFHGNQELKERTVAAMRAHAAADRFTRGSYLSVWSSAPGEWVGCFHGCLIAEAKLNLGWTPEMVNRKIRGWHRETEIEYGIPRVLGAVLDEMFETLIDAEDGAKFAIDTLEAMPAGADLMPALYSWLSGLLDLWLDENAKDFPAETNVVRNAQARFAAGKLPDEFPEPSSYTWPFVMSLWDLAHAFDDVEVGAAMQSLAGRLRFDLGLSAEVYYGGMIEALKRAPVKL